MKRIFFILIASTFVLSGFCLQSKQQINVVVASNMKNAMDSILRIYKQINPDDKIQVMYGSSGHFYAQISHGAPFDLFFSADMNYPKKLIIKEYALPPVKRYAIGKIVLWSKKLDPTKQQMQILSNPSVKKISVANPVTAPYGASAIESMKYFNLYNRVKDKLVYGENIIQTAQFASLGAADIGIIALSDALSPQMKMKEGKYYIIPQESYTVLEQGCVILKHGKDIPLTQKFYKFIFTKQVSDILTYYGYSY